MKESEEFCTAACLKMYARTPNLFSIYIFFREMKIWKKKKELLKI